MPGRRYRCSAKPSLSPAHLAHRLLRGAKNVYSSQLQNSRNLEYHTYMNKCGISLIRPLRHTQHIAYKLECTSFRGFPEAGNTLISWLLLSCFWLVAM